MSRACPADGRTGPRLLAPFFALLLLSSSGRPVFLHSSAHMARRPSSRPGASASSRHGKGRDARSVSLEAQVSLFRMGRRLQTGWRLGGAAPDEPLRQVIDDGHAPGPARGALCFHAAGRPVTAAHRYTRQDAAKAPDLLREFTWCRTAGRSIWKRSCSKKGACITRCRCGLEARDFRSPLQGRQTSAPVDAGVFFFFFFFFKYFIGSAQPRPLSFFLNISLQSPGDLLDHARRFRDSEREREREKTQSLQPGNHDRRDDPIRYRQRDP